jgi:two-component system cell cycle response regulator
MVNSDRVLVADGNLKTLNRVSECLRRLGFINLLETSAAEAASLAQSERPEVILVGLEFRDGSSENIIAALKASDVSRDIPVLLMIGEDGEPDWSANYITQYDEVIEWPLGDEQVLAHVTAALRLGTMQAELGRRSESLRSFGEKSANGWRTEDAVKPPHILLARGDAECDAAVEEDLKGCSVLETESLGSNLLSTLNGSDIEFVVISKNDDLGAMLDTCDDIRRNPTLFHIPILTICSSDTQEMVKAYQHGASAVISLPLDGGELRARAAMGAKSHRLRGHMLNAYRAGRNQSVCDGTTGLYSADFLRQHLQPLMDNAFRWDKSLSLNVVSVPQIEKIRADYGDAAADHLIQQLSGMMSRLVRGEDLCARLDDTTFCIALPESSLWATGATMQRMAGVLGFTKYSLLEVSSPINIHPRVGSSEYVRGDSVDDLIGRAVATAMAANAA